MLLLGCAVTAVAAALLSTPRPATAQFACVDASSSPQGATVTNPGDVACGPGATATGGGTFSTGATALGDSAFALGSATTTVGANAGSGVSVNGVTSIGANTNNSPSAPGVFSTAVGAGLLSLGDTTAAKSIGAYSIAIGGG
ncbi:MAG TPA: hypothetical protein VN803_09500, partial [Gemmatimonadales bacterium]|nr:hypothetical protein [Gemmatimonadales bacterium]